MPPEKIAMKAVKILEKKKPKFACPVNRNPLPRFYNAAPDGLKFFETRKILKEDGRSEKI